MPVRFEPLALQSRMQGVLPNYYISWKKYRSKRTGRVNRRNPRLVRMWNDKGGKRHTSFVCTLPKSTFEYSKAHHRTVPPEHRGTFRNPYVSSRQWNYYPKEVRQALYPYIFMDLRLCLTAPDPRGAEQSDDEIREILRMTGMEHEPDAQEIAMMRAMSVPDDENHDNDGVYFYDCFPTIDEVLESGDKILCGYSVPNELQIREFFSYIYHHHHRLRKCSENPRFCEILRIAEEFENQAEQRRLISEHPNPVAGAWYDED